MAMRKIFVTGVGTDVGKTVISSILVEALEADYWKPVQSGSFHGTDAQKVKSLVSNPRTKIHPEVYLLEKNLSPHAAAEAEGVNIEMEEIVLPHTTNTLIIEGAGGLLVPLNRRHFMIDLIKKFDCEVVLVSMNYLGSINHTLLSIETLRQRNINVRGIIFNGTRQPLSEDIILLHGHFDYVNYVNKELHISPEVISRYAQTFKTL